jgi:hypothetical protein
MGRGSHCATSSSCRNGSRKMRAPHPAIAFLGYFPISLSFSQTNGSIFPVARCRLDRPRSPASAPTSGRPLPPPPSRRGLPPLLTHRGSTACRPTQSDGSHQRGGGQPPLARRDPQPAELEADPGPTPTPSPPLHHPGGGLHCSAKREHRRSIRSAGVGHTPRVCKEGGRVEGGILVEFPCTPTRTRSV